MAADADVSLTPAVRGWQRGAISGDQAVAIGGRLRADSSPINGARLSNLREARYIVSASSTTPTSCFHIARHPLPVLPPICARRVTPTVRGEGL